MSQEILVVIASLGALAGGAIAGYYAKKGKTHLNTLTTELLEGALPNNQSTLRQRIEELMDVLSDVQMSVRTGREEIRETNRRVGRIETRISHLEQGQDTLQSGQEELVARIEKLEKRN